jgi:hypothetical protein
LAALDHPTVGAIVSRIVVGLLPFAVAVLGWAVYRLGRVDWARAQQAHLDKVGRSGTLDW